MIQEKDGQVINWKKKLKDSVMQSRQGKYTTYKNVYYNGKKYSVREDNIMYSSGPLGRKYPDHLKGTYPIKWIEKEIAKKQLEISKLPEGHILIKALEFSIEKLKKLPARY